MNVLQIWPNIPRVQKYHNDATGDVIYVDGDDIFEK